MIGGATWQDLVTGLAALLAATWLLRRWIRKRRARAGCDQCAASFLKAQGKHSAGTSSEAPRR